MTARVDRTVLAGIGMLVAVVALVIGGLSGAITGLFAKHDTRTVQVVFADAQQLRPRDGVRLQGVEIGKVQRVTLNGDGRTSTATLKIDRSAGPLYADARAILRWKTILGGSFYVDLERGSAARGTLSGPIPAGHTARQVELEDVVSTFRGGAVRGLQALPKELGDALQDERVPAHLFDTVARVAPRAEPGVAALRGTHEDDDLRGLVADASRTVRALDAPTGDLRAVVAGAAQTLQTVSGRDAEIRRTLAGSPHAQGEMDRTLVRLRTTLGLADPLLADLHAPATKVAPTLAALRPGVVDGRRLVARAVPLLRSLRPAAHGLAGVADRGLPLLKELEPSLDRIDETILPSLLEKDKGTSKSTAVMIGGTFAALGAGAAGQMDANGHFIRFPATSGSSPINSLPCQIYIANPDAAQLAACESLQEAMKLFLSYNPLGPTPGTQPPPPAGRSRKDR